MSAKHTQGPWHVAADPRNGDQHVRAGLGQTVALALELTQNGGRIGAEGNARLIAAAPDLLAACERVIEALKDHVLIAHSLEGAQTQGREICTQLNAAIAKAKGRP